MAEWQSMESAPKDGTPFIALNHDREVWTARYDDQGRLNYRTNSYHEPRRFEIIKHDGEELLREDKDFAKRNECWRSDWTIWSRLYEFKPTHWMPLPTPPQETAE